MHGKVIRETAPSASAASEAGKEVVTVPSLPTLQVDCGNQRQDTAVHVSYSSAL